MLYLNRVTIVGYAAADPEIIPLSQSKQNMARFSVATKTSWTDKTSGEKVDKTEWHRIVIFDEFLVEQARNTIKKGSRISLEGSLRTRKWVDPKDNSEKYSTEILVSYSGLLLVDNNKPSNNSNNNIDNRNNSYSSNNSTTTPESSTVTTLNKDTDNDFLDDEIPF